MKKLLGLVLIVAAVLCLAASACALQLVCDSTVATDYEGNFDLVVSLDETTALRSIRLCYDEPMDGGIEFVSADVPYGLIYSVQDNEIIVRKRSGVFYAGYLATLHFKVNWSNASSDLCTYIWTNGAVGQYNETVDVTCSDYIWISVNGVSSGYSAGPVYGYTIDKLSTRTGPSTTYTEGGTYNVKNQWVPVYAKAWDTRNEIWWVKVGIEYHGETRYLWTGYKRFDHSTLFLDDLPTEVW